ncbi:BTAD domain-containing putative transcriptional regulator [Roseisolibacter agri]|uniref:Bacterial transcriptional activator domain-containing protein n=1 Tax=Roseisolibacter agri TaxID=2014610 RepID=A0AA37Q2C7_9BACT|nr:BTAD domain-containing putative transcriptional regulator [Roseisolibacter agri]GLC25104.1 hypothetical protein rosag_16170 [Roseisolibacter agri]
MLSLRFLGTPELLQEGRVVTGAAAQRHRVALLALLAHAAPRAVSRDRLLALLWPESEALRARHRLNVAVHALRQTFGPVVVSQGDELRLDTGLVVSDLGAFEAAVTAGDARRVVTLYSGPLLDGLFLKDAATFEAWVEGERARLARQYAGALEELADAAERDGDTAGAVEWWGRLVAHDPCRTHSALGLMRALDAAGDRAGALRHAELHARLMTQELDAAPDPLVESFARQLRVAPWPPTPPSLTTEPGPPLDPPPAVTAPPLRSGDQRPVAVPSMRPAIASRARLMGHLTVGAGVALVAVTTVAIVLYGGRVVTPADAVVSPAAQALYREGLAGIGALDSAAVFRLLTSALREDPRLARAAVLAGRIAPNDSTRIALFAKAESLAVHASTRDRLYVRTVVGTLTLDSARLAASDTLAAHHADDVEAMAARGQLLTYAGRYETVVAELTPVVRRTAARGDEVDGALSEAYVALYESHISLAAFDDAERVAREWIARMPDRAAGWERLADVLTVRGRCAAADSALAVPPMRVIAASRLRPALRLACEGDYAGAADWLGVYARVGDSRDRGAANWLRLIAERYAGRHEVAARHAAALCESMGPSCSPFRAHAQILLERGRPREAAAAFALAADWAPLAARSYGRLELTASGGALQRAWYLTHVATSLLAAGELDRAAALADTIAALVRPYVSGRGSALPHQVRGMVLAARARRAGDPAHAAQLRREAIAELRHALGRPFRGLPRARLELARLLVDEGRAGEAVAVLRPAAWRGLEQANLFYVTGPEFRLALAEAYDAAAQPDSAAAEYGRVLAAWRVAEPALDARRARVARRRAGLDRGSPRR